MTKDTKFSDMSPHDRRAWLAFANSHDWGGERLARYSMVADGTLRMVTTGAAWTAENWPFTEIAVHQTPRQLRAWAGY